jgi:hypothetical protein
MYPVALFVYKRPELTRKTLDALRANPEFGASSVFVYCDGPKTRADAALVEATRDVIRSYHLPNATLIERERNLGLANSIIAGVTELCTKYGAVIVVEDDLVVSRCFLNYMNKALTRYADEHRVMEIAGHTFVNCERDLAYKPAADAVFLDFATSWGWATWQRAWRYFDASMSGLTRLVADRSLRRQFDLDRSYPFYSMLKQAAAGRVDSWAIRWYLSIFFQNGLILYPVRTLVQYVGNDGAGTHVTRFSRTRTLEAPQEFRVERFPSEIVIDAVVLDAARTNLRSLSRRQFWRRWW